MRPKWSHRAVFGVHVWRVCFSAEQVPSRESVTSARTPRVRTRPIYACATRLTHQFALPLSLPLSDLRNNECADARVRRRPMYACATHLTHQFARACIGVVYIKRQRTCQFAWGRVLRCARSGHTERYSGVQVWRECGCAEQSRAYSKEHARDRDKRKTLALPE